MFRADLRGVLLLVLLSSACAPRLMKLPAGPPAPASDVREALAGATMACRGVTSFSAEIAVSGSVGDQKVRGRLLAGLASPASARLEAVAPFGQPLFIFVARDADATLLLRDDRVLERARPDAVLAALTGVPVDGAELRTVLTGCTVAADREEGRRPGEDWRVVPDGATDVYLHRESRSAPWRIVAAIHKGGGLGDWRAEYRDFQNGLPRSIRLVSTNRKRFDLRLVLSQVDVNPALGPEVFRVDVPRGATPISLEELQEAGPLGVGRPKR